MIVIVDCGLGNVASIRNMLKKVGAECVMSADPATIEKASKLILPGVGAFDTGVSAMRERGVIPSLERRVLGERIPILGICLGMQLLTRQSEEGVLPGLGWVAGETRRFGSLAPFTERIPHMGWNLIEPRPAAHLFTGLPPEPRFYFVHSYHVQADDPGAVAATANYGYEFTAAVQHGHIYGVQFHPEKSHKFGLALLKTFAELPC